MTENTESKEAAELIGKLISLLSPREKRAEIVRMLMRSGRINAADIARKHHFTRWYMAGCIGGQYKWSPKVVLALEAELRVKLRPLLSADEAERMAEYEAR